MGTVDESTSKGMKALQRESKKAYWIKTLGHDYLETPS